MELPPVALSLNELTRFTPLEMELEKGSTGVFPFFLFGSIVIIISRLQRLLSDSPHTHREIVESVLYLLSPPPFLPTSFLFVSSYCNARLLLLKDFFLPFLCDWFCVCLLLPFVS